MPFVGFKYRQFFSARGNNVVWDDKYGKEHSHLASKLVFNEFRLKKDLFLLHNFRAKKTSTSFTTQTAYEVL